MGGNLTTRRGIVGGLLVLNGCGFRPLYKPVAGGGSTVELGHIYVPVIQERSGQLLRQALQQRFDGSDAGHERKYELIAALQIGFEGVAIQRDSSTSRIRIDGFATWTLRALTPLRPVLSQGTSRVLDGYNVTDQQFFAAELESDSAIRRITGSLADQVTIQVSSYFLKQAQAT